MHARPVIDDLGAISAMLSGLTTAEAAAMASGKPVSEHRILLVVEPAKLAHLRETLETLSRYVSQITLWVFDPSRPDSLRSMNAADLLNELAERQREQLPKVDVQPHAVSTRTLRLHTDEGSPGAPASASDMLTTASGSTEWTGPWNSSPVNSSPATQPLRPSPAVPAERPAQPSLRITHDADARGSEKPTTAPQASAQAHAPARAPNPGSEKPGPAQARERVHDEPATPEPLLTDEELQMLLGDDPPRPTGRKG